MLLCCISVLYNHICFFHTVVWYSAFISRQTGMDIDAILLATKEPFNWSQMHKQNQLGNMIYHTNYFFRYVPDLFQGHCHA